jgi:lipopolysaccharide assembly outer membrane protein LptD (OstA)
MDRHDPERRPFSNMGIEFDLSPHKYFSLRVRDQYNYYSGWKQNSYDLHVRDWRGDSLMIGYRKVDDSIEEINLGLKAVITGNIYSTLALRHDLLNSRKIENSIGLVYHKQCWGIGLDYTETEDDVRFLLKISLAGFGKQLAQ